MPLFFGDALELLQHLVQVPRSWVWHFVLEVEVYPFSCRHRDCILALVLLYELPKGIGAKLLLETQCHNLVFLDLRPLYSI